MVAPALLLSASVALTAGAAGRTYQHTLFSLQVPRGWKVAGEVKAGGERTGESLVLECAGGVRLTDAKGNYLELLISPEATGACVDGWWRLTASNDGALRVSAESVRLKCVVGDEAEDGEECGCTAGDGKLTMGGVAPLTPESTAFVWFGNGRREKKVDLAVFRRIVASVRLADAARGLYPLMDWGHRDLASCGATGRFQDSDHCRSDVIVRIVADGKRAIPIVISQITDERLMPEPVLHFWPPIRVGEFAFLILDGLFYERNWQRTMPDLFPEWRCTGEVPASECWARFRAKHSLADLRERWSRFWEKNEHAIRWDESARCFRLEGQDEPPARAP